MQGIGKRIQKIREAAGLKQELLAEMVDLSCNYLSAIERDVKTPRLDTFVRIINALNVSADEILMDVLEVGTKTRCTQLEEKMKHLPAKERNKILRVLEVMIEEAGK